MQRAADLFTEQDQKAIEAAVTAAEARTSAEIVPVVATVSGRYDRAEDLFGMVVALLALSIAWFALPELLQTSGWGPEDAPALGLPVILLIVAGGFVAGSVLASWLPAFRRPFISRREKRDEVERAAAEAFFRFRVRGTDSGTGVLIYISLYERMVRVLGDDAVAAKLSQEDWDGVRDLVIEGLRRKQPADGLARAIARCGDLCAGHFPAEPGQRDNLSNELRTAD